MLLDDVYAELRTKHDVPLRELDGVTLQTILELLQQARAERAENEEKRIASEEKVITRAYRSEQRIDCYQSRKRGFAKPFDD